MNTLILIALLAADIPDFGIISPRRAMTLGVNTTRPDFVCFTVEVRPESSPTNIVTFTTTNRVLTVMKFARVPSGPGILGVTANYADGEESEMTLRRYDLRRGRPSAPSIEAVHTEGAGMHPKSLQEELRKIRGEQMVPVPPMPPNVLQYDIQNVPRKENVYQTDIRKPLPDATNRAYADHLDWLADRAAVGKRRSE